MMRAYHAIAGTLAAALAAGCQTTTPGAGGVAIPADAEHAVQALGDSPRHGEWVDVRPDAPEAGAAPVRTWVVYPQRSDPAPVVVVIHEIFGLTDWVRAVADQLAAEGFIAVAPDLLSGKGPGGGGTESFAADDVRSAIRALSDDEVARRLDAVRDYALALPSSGDASACIGFCWGGSTSFAYATAQPGLAAAVVYYGTPPANREALGAIACPVLGLYGGDDARVTSTVGGTAATMRQLGKSYEHHVYEGAGHGFLRQQSGRGGANLSAARQAWERTLAFLKEHLG